MRQLNPSKLPMPKPKALFTRVDFSGKAQQPENYIHLRDNVNIINHDAQKKNKKVRRLLNKSVELTNKFKKENGNDRYMGLDELNVGAVDRNRIGYYGNFAMRSGDRDSGRS